MSSCLRSLWVRWLLAAAILRTCAAVLVPVLPEEAYHWCYARHPDFSYYDHPPMIAWMIAIGRFFFGDTALGIRFVPLLASIGSAAAVGWTARRLFGEDAAKWTVLLVSLQPATFLASGFGFPDAPMLFFWSLSTALTVHTLETGKGAGWLAAGAALGAAILSKYTACFLGASIFLFLLISPRDRRWLATPWPYLGFLLMLAVFSPVIYWNAIHDWASFKFQGGRVKEAAGPRLMTILGHVGGQWGGYVPLVLPLAVVAIVAAIRRRTREELLLLCLFLPMSLFFLVIGVTQATHVFWTLPSFGALAILMAAAWVRGEGRVVAFYGRTWKGCVAVSILILAAGAAYAVRPFSWTPPLRDVYDWPEMAVLARGLKSGLPAGSFYLAVGRRYMTAGQLAFHVDAPLEVQAKNLIGDDGLGFAFWTDPQTLAGRDAVVVLEDSWYGDPEARLLQHFRAIEEVGEWTVRAGSWSRQDRKGMRYRFFIARGYRP